MIFQREKKWLDTFISKCETDPRCGGLMLRDYLIEPVQRVPRYEMLLKEMAKHTSEDDPERGGLLDAVSKVQEVAHDMNRTITEKEMREKVSELSVLWGANFAAPSRIFVREGFLSSDNSHGKQTTYCFLLFNDLFVYGRERTSLEMTTSMGLSSKRFKLKYQGEGWRWGIWRGVAATRRDASSVHHRSSPHQPHHSPATRLPVHPQPPTQPPTHSPITTD